MHFSPAVWAQARQLAHKPFLRSQKLSCRYRRMPDSTIRGKSRFVSEHYQKSYQVRSWLFIVDSVKSIRLSLVQGVGIGEVLVGKFGLFIRLRRRPRV